MAMDDESSETAFSQTFSLSLLFLLLLLILFESFESSKRVAPNMRRCLGPVLGLWGEGEEEEISRL
jgi:hypothetical protein